MLRMMTAALLLTPATALAAELSCKDAAAFYNYSIFTSKVLGAVSGACAEDVSQPACAALLQVFQSDGRLVEKAKEGDVTAHLNYLKAQCPGDFPDDPGKL